MSAEEMVRAKHQLERELAELVAALRYWRAQFALLNRQELEIVVARALDRATDEPDSKSILAKLWSLTEWLSQIPSDYRPPAFRRFWLLSDAQTVERRFFDQKLPIPSQLGEAEFRQLARGA